MNINNTLILIRSLIWYNVSVARDDEPIDTLIIPMAGYTLS